MKKFNSASFDLKTEDGHPVYGDLRGNYSLGGNAYDKYGAPHGTINITIRDDGNGKRRIKILAEAQAALGIKLQWASAPKIFGLSL